MLQFSRSLAAGTYHSVVLTDDHSIWCFGKNVYGVFGCPSVSSKTTPIKIEIPSEISYVQAVCSSSVNSFIIDQEDYVWRCGANNYGQLGKGENNVASSDFYFQKLLNIPKIQFVSASPLHSLMLDSDGAVWSCGNDEQGQLGWGGDLRLQVNTIPHKIPNIPPIQMVAAGNFHSLFLDADGCVWGCGSNAYNQLGCERNCSCFEIQKVKGLETIKFICSGSFHSIFITDEGGVQTTGRNDANQLGTCTSLDRKMVTIENLNRIRFASASLSFSAFLDEYGDVYCCGKISPRQNVLATPQQILNLPEINYFQVGLEHMLLIDSDGIVWAFGDNSYGQLGLEDTRFRKSPEKIQNLPAYILSTNFSLTKSARNI